MTDTPTGILALRDFVLTSGMRLWATAVMEESLDQAFEESHDLIGWTDPAVPLSTCLRWAWTDVAWYFADMTSQLGDSRDFLIRIGEAAPDTVGPDVTRDLTDLRCLLALAATVHDAEHNRNEDPFGQTVAFTLGVLMGMCRAWPDRLEALGPYMVDDLLATMLGWARNPADLDVWTREAPREFDRILLPRRTMIVARAAGALEGSYDAYFGHLAAQAAAENM